MTENAAATAATDAAVEEFETPPRPYWGVVFSAYGRHWRNIVALGFVLMTGLLAVFVPFIANGRPYTAIVDGERRYPLFKSLTRVDLIVLLIGVAAIAWMVLWYVTRKKEVEEGTMSVRAKAGWALAGAALVGSLLIWFCGSDYNDLLHREDYAALTPDYEIQGAVWAPLHWGYAEQEFPLKRESLFQNPNAAHLLGTDGGGRDALARLLWSARVVFGIGLISVGIQLIVGIIYGAMMGYFGGRADILGMRFVEIVEAVPTFFLLITIVAVFGRQLFMIMVILGLTGWTGIARFVRAEFFRIRKLDYVAAAIAAGLPLRSILFRHMLPNGLTPVLVTATFSVASAVTLESSLSFLGLGVEPPTASWGAMLSEAADPSQTFHFWLAFAPGVLIFLTIFAWNIIGEGFHEAIDPRLSKME